MSKLSKRHFWEWFKRNNKEYSEILNKSKKESAYLINELNAHLRAYYKFLGFTLTVAKNELPSLTINVRGKSRHFKHVESFVGAAPEIPGWKINALDDAAPADFLLEDLIEELVIHPDEFYFSFDGDDAESGIITLYHSLCTTENENMLHNLANAAVYNVLGERCFGDNIQYLIVDNLSSARAEIYKLEELPAMMGSVKSSMIVDTEGRLVEMY